MIEIKKGPDNLTIITLEENESFVITKMFAQLGLLVKDGYLEPEHREEFLKSKEFYGFFLAVMGAMIKNINDNDHESQRYEFEPLTQEGLFKVKKVIAEAFGGG